MKFSEKYSEEIEFLLENGGTAVRYRTLSELCDDPNMLEIKNLKQEITDTEQTIKLINYLKNRRGYHGATLLDAEVSLNMLVDMGVKYGCGFEKFDIVMDEMAVDVKEHFLLQYDCFRIFFQIIMIPFLYRAGMRDTWIKEFILNRLAVIYDFVKHKNYDIYEEPNKHNLPAGYKGRPVVKPELYENGDFQIPLEYDLYGFSEMYFELKDEDKKKTDVIIDYIFDKKFQTIHDGYGILVRNKNQKRYICMGWDPKPTNLHGNHTINPLLLKLDCFARIPSAVKTPWFKEAVKIIDQYACSNGIYNIPKEYLTEKDSVWMLGYHMNLGENRRKKTALTVTGTFRALKIHKLINRFALN